MKEWGEMVGYMVVGRKIWGGLENREGSIYCNSLTGDYTT